MHCDTGCRRCSKIINVCLFSSSFLTPTLFIYKKKKVIYDASVLHFGSANTVEGNDRAVFYFGFAPHGGASALAGTQPTGYKQEKAVHLNDFILT